jgi:hypothetical protein
MFKLIMVHGSWLMAHGSAMVGSSPGRPQGHLYEGGKIEENRCISIRSRLALYIWGPEFEDDDADSASQCDGYNWEKNYPDLTPERPLSLCQPSVKFLPMPSPKQKSAELQERIDELNELITSSIN